MKHQSILGLKDTNDGQISKQVTIMASISHSPLSVRSPGPNGAVPIPNNSPHGQHASSPADDGSPSIRKRFTKSLRRTLHQSSSDTREENKSPRGLGRRKSIVDLFGSISKSRRQSVQGSSKDESSLDVQDPASPTKATTGEIQSNKVL